MACSPVGDEFFSEFFYHRSAADARSAGKTACFSEFLEARADQDWIHAHKSYPCDPNSYHCRVSLGIRPLCFSTVFSVCLFFTLFTEFLAHFLAQNRGLALPAFQRFSVCSS
jgi:hypothetical protein